MLSVSARGGRGLEELASSAGSVGVAGEGEDLGVVYEPVDHRCGDDVVADTFLERVVYRLKDLVLRIQLFLIELLKRRGLENGRGGNRFLGLEELWLNPVELFPNFIE